MISFPLIPCLRLVRTMDASSLWSSWVFSILCSSLESYYGFKLTRDVSVAGLRRKWSRLQQMKRHTFFPRMLPVRERADEEGLFICTVIVYDQFQVKIMQSRKYLNWCWIWLDACICVCVYKYLLLFEPNMLIDFLLSSVKIITSAVRICLFNYECIYFL